MHVLISIFKRLAVPVVCLALTACAGLGSAKLSPDRLDYNNTVKTSSEQELLLNIVRLRYTDTPSSLAISAIAAQYETTKTLGVTPFFALSGDAIAHRATAILPQAQVSAAERPTFSLTPLDDQEFTRKLFTPIPLDGLIYLAKTTWPISTVFRLYLENMNWVSNAESASGPTPQYAPIYQSFKEGIEALQKLQIQGMVVIGIENREDPIQQALPLNKLGDQMMAQALKNGYEVKLLPDGKSAKIVQKIQKPVLYIAPAAINSPEVKTFTKAFHLKHGLHKYDITDQDIEPFSINEAQDKIEWLDLETRSLLQALYYVSHGVNVPPEHLARGLARQTLEQNQQAFDWHAVVGDLFTVYASQQRPSNAHTAVQYQNYWFYIDEADINTKSTFSLLMELSRLELNDKKTSGPLLTLPVSR